MWGFMEEAASEYGLIQDEPHFLIWRDLIESGVIEDTVSVDDKVIQTAKHKKCRIW